MAEKFFTVSTPIFGESFLTRHLQHCPHAQKDHLTLAPSWGTNVWALKRGLRECGFADVAIFSKLSEHSTGTHENAPKLTFPCVSTCTYPPWGTKDTDMRKIVGGNATFFHFSA